MSKLNFEQLDELDAQVAQEEMQEARGKVPSTARRSVIEKALAAEVEAVKTKITPGPKKRFEMQTVSFNFEKSIAQSIEDYCEQHMLRKSEFVRTILKEKMEELGYRFSLEDLKEGKFEKANN